MFLLTLHSGRPSSHLGSTSQFCSPKLPRIRSNSLDFACLEIGNTCQLQRYFHEGIQKEAKIPDRSCESSQRKILRAAIREKPLTSTRCVILGVNGFLGSAGTPHCLERPSPFSGMAVVGHREEQWAAGDQTALVVARDVLTLSRM